MDAGTGEREALLQDPVASPPPQIASEFTPITDFRELGEAVGEIKADIKTVKVSVDKMEPKLDRAIEGIVNHRARIKVSEARLKRAEEKVSSIAETPHSCFQSETIADLKEAEKAGRKERSDISQVVVTAKTTLGNVTDDVITLESDKRIGRRWIIGLVVGVVLALGGAASGIIIVVYVVQSNVDHMQQEQTRLRNQMDDVRITVAKDGSRVEAAARRVETAAKSVAMNGHAKLLISDDVWCDLSHRERNKLKRRYPSDRLPSRRCP